MGQTELLDLEEFLIGKQSYFNTAASLWTTTAKEKSGTKLSFSINYSPCLCSGQITCKVGATIYSRQTGKVFVYISVGVRFIFNISIKPRRSYAPQRPGLVLKAKHADLRYRVLPTPSVLQTTWMTSGTRSCPVLWWCPAGGGTGCPLSHHFHWVKHPRTELGCPHQSVQSLPVSSWNADAPANYSKEDGRLQERPL